MKFVEDMCDQSLPEHTESKGTSVLMRGRKEAAGNDNLRQKVEGMPPRTVAQEIGDQPGPHRNSATLLRQIEAGTIAAKDLSPEERRNVVKALKDSGRTQDEIADLLNVSRRTVVSDFKWLREASANEIRELDIYNLAGEVYSVATSCISKAMSDGLYRTVSYVMRDMVEMLQSLGVVYRAPLQHRSVQMTGRMPTDRVAFSRYIEAIHGEEDKVSAILDRMMSGIESGEIS